MAFNALRMLPNDKIIRMYENASKQSAQGKGKKFMIRYLLDSGKMKIMTDGGDGEDSKTEIVMKRKTQMILQVLNKLQKKFSVTSDDYTTTETVRAIYPKVIEDMPENMIPFFKPNFMSNVEKFLPGALQAQADGAPEKEVFKMIIDGYKDLFILIPLEHQDAILGTIDMCATNFRERTDKSQNPANSFLEFVSAKYHYEGQDHVRFGGKFNLPDMDVTEISCNDVDMTQTEDECPDTPLVNSHIPDIEEAPQEPVQQEATPPPNRPDPVVKVITDEVEKTNIKENVGTLMFPNTYRQIMTGELTKQSWAKIRKAHNLKGRWEIYVNTNPGDNPKQNKHIKYKSPHFVEPTFEGAYPCEGLHVSDHPYGDIYLVQ